jgi:hypothetical protein
MNEFKLLFWKRKQSSVQLPFHVGKYKKTIDRSEGPGKYPSLQPIRRSREIKGETGYFRPHREPPAEEGTPRSQRWPVSDQQVCTNPPGQQHGFEAAAKPRDVEQGMPLQTVPRRAANKMEVSLVHFRGDPLPVPISSLGTTDNRFGHRSFF